MIDNHDFLLEQIIFEKPFVWDPFKQRRACVFFFQNEGDSAHSAISIVLSQVEGTFIPSQLYLTIELARRKNSYKVIPMGWSNKKLRQKIKLDRYHGNNGE